MRNPASAVLFLALTAIASLPSTSVAQQVPPADASRRITVCVLRDGEIVDVAASLDAASGDTVVDGRPFGEVHAAGSPRYAAGSEWYINHEMLPFHGRRLAKYGLVFTIPRDLLRRVGEFRGMPLFAEAGTSGVPDVVYVFVRPGCVFQSYQVDYHVGAVRGGR